MYSQDRPIKTQIWKKGLLLVIIPCLIGTFFLWQLYDLTARTEKLAASERAETEILRHANNIMTLYAVTTAKYVNYSMGNKGDKAMADDFSKRLHSEFALYSESAKDQPELLNIVINFRKKAEFQLLQLQNLHVPRNSGSMTDIVTAMATLAPSYRNFLKQAGTDTTEIMRIVDAEQAKIDQTRREQEESRSQTKQLVLWGILGNTLLAGALALWFLRNVTDRLRVLVDNARKLPKLLPLNQKVKGTDELTYLDGVLHDAHTELRNAAEQRQYLMDMVGHDLRSPLMSSQVALEILGDSRVGDLTPLGKRQLESLSRNMKRLTALTSDLLTVDKLEQGKLEITLAKVDLFDAVEESIESLSDLAKKKKISLINECEHGMIPVDKMRVGQVLTNLLSNAIKFSPDNESITVRSQRERESVTIFVIDRGPGIALEDQEKIFEKYGQLANGTGKGFGLGLAICKFIVEAHGGTINVKSKPGQGCMFWFRLPTREVLGADVFGDLHPESATETPLEPTTNVPHGSAAESDV